ncbi:MAG: glycosyltransferase [Bacteroidota bacterium]
MVGDGKADRLRILVLPSWFPPDGGEFFLEQAENLCSESTRVHILVNRLTGITSGVRAFAGAKKITLQQEGCVRIFRSGTRKWPRTERLNIRRWARRYLKLYKWYESKYGVPDVLIAHSAVWAGYAASGICENTGIPMILVEHRSRFALDSAEARKMIPSWYLPMLREAFARANTVVTVSSSLIPQIRSIQPELRAEPLTIPNLVDTGFFTLPVQARSAEPYVILFVGLLEEVKGIDILLQAFSQLGPDSRLRIAGRGSREKELKILTAKLGLEDRVVFLGQISREQVRDEMQNASVFVLPSHFEAFGVVLIEAMSTGCPLISTRSGGPEEIITRECGILVAPGNEMELRQALETVRANYRDLDPLAIRELALAKYSGNVIQKAYFELINNIIHEQGTPGI